MIRTWIDARLAMRGATLLVALAVLAVASPAVASGASTTSAVATPTVSGPVTGGTGTPTLLGMSEDPASFGYVKEEYFVEGDATAFDPIGTLGADGKWKVALGSTAPYKTRIVVWKPADPKDFNGTVFVEWLNVTAGFDAPPDWIGTHRYLLAQGVAYVAVSAQRAGVSGSASAAIDIPQAAALGTGGLRGADPARYESLAHPGDGYSYDIFSQAGLAVRGKGDGPNPLDGYKVKRVIAMGQSQSAARLSSYVNAAHKDARVYDGYLVHSRGSRSASLLVEPPPSGTVDPAIPEGGRIRTDLDVPVLLVEAEGDVRNGYALARQPDTAEIRLWEVAGAAHLSGYPSQAEPEEAALTVLDPAKATGGPLKCAQSINAGVLNPVVVAAVGGLEDWVSTGKAPKRAPRIDADISGTTITINRDEHGFALGGLRTPLVEAPLALNTGEPNTATGTGSASNFCRSFGTSLPLDAATLAALYPDGDRDYVRQFERSAQRAVADGYWLPSDAKRFVAAAKQMTVG
jgi:hypothetical protein